MLRLLLLLPSLLLLAFFIDIARCADDASSASERCPLECPVDCAADELDCKKTVLDECGCCPVCVRHLGEACGETGVCEDPLQCTQHNETAAICTRPGMDSCLHASCPVVFHPPCPVDSRLLISPPPSGHCCGEPGVCVCDRLKCAASVPECAEGTERVLTRPAGAKAGECCEEFECREREAHCHGHACPPLPPEEGDDGVEGDSDACPADSARPPPHLLPGQCCPLRPRCRCRASVCRPAVCPEGQVVRVLQRGTGRPGSCCDEWTCDELSQAKGCEHDGRLHLDGDEWANSSCEQCRCRKGVAACSKMQCPKPPSKCTWIVIPEGECCPLCVGCQTEKLEKKKKNETWARDDCTTCTCSESGEPVCEKHMCRADCDNPRKVDGQCCPVCDEPTILTLPSTCPSLEHCPLRCENGLRRDDRGCFVCDCLPASQPDGGVGDGSGVARPDCPQLDSGNCEKQCAHGYVRDSAGCAVCRCAKCPPLHQCLKHCLYGFETNSVGCPVCKCRAMARIEAKLTVSEKLSRLAGWDRCVSYSFNGKLTERDGGEWWSDGCRHCFCEQRQEYCSLITCPERPADCKEEHWQRAEGACCASCHAPLSSSSSEEAETTGQAISSSQQRRHEHTVCQSPGTGRLFTDGETWQLAPCVSCTCRVGHVLCRVADCPPTACSDPQPDPANQCCAVCPSSSSSPLQLSNNTTAVCMEEGGVARPAGSVWRADDCTSCICTLSGKMECYRQSCPPLSSCKGVPLVLKGRCCPVCSDALSTDAVCAYGNSVYAVREEWRDGACRNCSCVQGGQTVCREFLCPACPEPIPVVGQCCPLCNDVGGWAPFGEGNGSVVMSPESSSSPFALLALSLGLTCTLLFLVFLFLLYKRWRGAIRKSCGLKKGEPSAVSLKGTRRVDSHLFLAGEEDPMAGPPGAGGLSFGVGGGIGARRNSGAQSESLLSTTSECSSSGASSSSSGHGPHTDRQPLTPSKAKSSPSPKNISLIRDDQPLVTSSTASPRREV